MALAENVVPIAFGRGLLVEPAITNNCLRSADLGTTWTNTNSSESLNATTAPDGTATADKLVEDATAGVGHSISQGIGLTSGVTYTQSIYAKAGERSWIALLGATTRLTVTAQAFFDLTNGVVGSIVGAGVTSKIESIGNGWYRCSMGNLVCDSTGTNAHSIQLATGDLSEIYNGDGVSGAFLYGAQLENNPNGVQSEASSYIPTVAATVTRATDLVSCLTSQFPYSITNGTIITWGRSIVADMVVANGRPFSLKNAGGGNEVNNIQRNTGSSPDSYGLSLFSGGVQQVNPTVTLAGSVSSTNGNKFAAFYKLNDSGILADGGSEVVDTLCTMPAAIDTLYMGCQDSAAVEFHGYLQRFIYVPRRMTQAEMQTRTV